MALTGTTSIDKSVLAGSDSIKMTGDPCRSGFSVDASQRGGERFKFSKNNNNQARP
jgi:hypothetical protein